MLKRRIIGEICWGVGTVGLIGLTWGMVQRLPRIGLVLLLCAALIIFGHYLARKS